MKNDKMKMQYRVNEQIRVREVRIVGDNVEPVVMPTHKALQLAEQKGLDLVEISPNAAPPVCRLIDYSKFLYQQKKRQKELKKYRDSLQKGDKIMTTGGIFGKVVEINDYTVIIEVESQARLKVSKEAIVKDMTDVAAQSK